MKSNLFKTSLLFLSFACGTTKPAGKAPAVPPNNLTCPNGTNAECTSPDTCTGGTCYAPTNLTAPTVTAVAPLDGATSVPLNTSVSVTFGEAMDPTTLTNSAFSLSSGGNTISGTVIYANSIAVFWPASKLASSTSYTATLSTGAMSASDVAIAKADTWTFTTGTTEAPGLPVNLGTASGFVILAKSGISTVPTSAITGNIGVSPAAASYMTGFSIIPNPQNVFTSSAQVTGKIFASDYAKPTPANMTAAISDMQLAFTDAAGRAPDVTELGAGNIGGMTLTAGVYKWGTGVLIPTNVTLTGSATDVWVFQIAQGLTIASATSIVLAGGALAKNVFWQVSGSVVLGTTAHLEGVVMSQTSIAFATGASINGKLLAQTAVSIDGSTVIDVAQ